MNKLILMMAALSLVSTVGFAAAKGGSSGQNEVGSDACGLGWQVTDKKTLIATTTRGTTNAVVPSSFGMTTGTMGCDQHSFAKRDIQGIQYVAANYEPLMNEIAEGRGEYLEAFAQQIGCSSVYSDFARTLQQNYSEIRKGSTATPVDVYSTLRNAAKTNSVVAAGCGII